MKLISAFAICSFILLAAQEATISNPVVNQVLALEPGANQQRRILEMLPVAFQSPGDWNRLRAHLDVNLLEVRDCRLMTRTVLLLDAAYKGYPQFVRPPLNGEKPDPVGLLVNRIKNLVLSDPVGFDQYRYPPGRMSPVGTLDDFWRELLNWAEKHGGNSQAILEIRDEIAKFGPSSAKDPVWRPATVSVPLSPSPKPFPPHDNSRAPVAPPAPERYALWFAWSAIVLGGGGIFWIIARRAKQR